MNIQEIIDRAKAHGIDAITAAVEEARRRDREAWESAEAAYKAYFADVEQREAKIKQRITDLTGQEDGIKAKIAAMQPGLVNATVSGDTEAFDRIQGNLADLEAKKAAIATQIELLSGATLPGNQELYRAAAAKFEAKHEAAQRFMEEIEVIRDFAREQAEAWKEIEDKLFYASPYYPVHAKGEDEEKKLERHFMYQGRDPLAQQKETPPDEPQRVKNCETAVYRFGQM